MSVERFNCPDCGVGVRADEDGCCAHCGADCEIVAVEATPPKHEHEFSGYRVVWWGTCDGDGEWSLEEVDADGWHRVDPFQDIDWGSLAHLAAEIARLAGLTKPEDSK